MPDCKEMYLTLTRETEKAIRVLTAARQTREGLYLRDEGPTLLIPPTTEIPAEKDRAAE